MVDLTPLFIDIAMLAVSISGLVLFLSILYFLTQAGILKVYSYFCNEPKKLCTDCKWWDGDTYHRYCKGPVDNIGIGYRPCYSARTIFGGCGPNAKFWEVKE